MFYPIRTLSLSDRHLFDFIWDSLACANVQSIVSSMTSIGNYVTSRRKKKYKSRNVQTEWRTRSDWLISLRAMFIKVFSDAVPLILMLEQQSEFVAAHEASMVNSSLDDGTLLYFESFRNQVERKTYKKYYLDFLVVLWLSEFDWIKNWN